MNRILSSTLVGLLFVLAALGQETKTIPSSWDYEKDGLEVLPVLDFTPPQGDNTANPEDPETKKAVEEMYQKFQEIINQPNPDWKAAKRIVDAMVKRYEKFPRVGAIYYEFCNKLARKKAKANRELLIESCKELTEHYPRYAWSTMWMLQQATGTRINFYNYGQVQVEPGTVPKMRLNTQNIDKVHIAVYKVDLMKMAKSGQPIQAPAVPVGAKPVKEWDHTPEHKSGNRRWSYEEIEIPVKESGAYLVQLSHEYYSLTTMVFVTRLALMTKNDGRMLLCYASNVRDGKQPGELEIAIQDNHRLIYHGKTNDDGLFAGQLKGKGASPLVVVRRGDDYAVCFSRWGRGYYGYQNRMHIYTERPIYRPAQTVHMKFVPRTFDRDSGEYTFSPDSEIQVTIRDPKWNQVLQEKIKTNEYGTASLDFPLAEVAALGNYHVQVRGDNMWGNANFQVKEYKKPEYEVSAEPTVKHAIIGDKVGVDISAKYFFGEPVKNAEVSYEVYLNRSYWYPWYGCGFARYSWYIDDMIAPPHRYHGGRQIDQGKGKLGPDGKLSITVDTKRAEIKPDQGYGWNLSVRVSVIDKSRRSIQGYADIPLGRAAIKVHGRPDRWSYKPGEKVTINVRTTTLGNEPIAKEVHCIVKRRDDHRNKATYTELFSDKITTDAQGNGQYTFVPDVKGSFRVELIAVDDKGREVKSQAHVWVADRSWHSPYSYNGLDAKADKEAYKIGDTARIVITTGHKDHPVLITADADFMESYTVTRFNGSMMLHEQKISKRMSPSAQVHIVLFADGRYVNKNLRLITPPESKWLNVEIKPDKAQYKPGDQAAYTVTLTDHEGKPVQGEISFGLVDEAIYAMAKDRTKDIRKVFYGYRHSYIYPQLSFNFRAQGVGKGDAAQKSMRAANGAPAPALEREASADAFAEPAEGAGRAMAKRGRRLVAPRLRTEFADAAVWKPHLATDENGKAVVSFRMPDNLTTWRAKVIAIDKKSRVGQATDKTITRQLLMVRLERPRTFTEGDEVTISAVVHNYLSGAKSCVVRLQNSAGELVKGKRETEIKLEPGQDKRVDWCLKVNTHLPIKLQVAALTDEESDAMEETAEVVPYGLRIVKGEGGLTNTATKVDFHIPQETQRNSTNVQIDLSPSLAASMFESLDYLTGYPYGCVEQTMSRFLPNILVVQSMEKLNIENQELKEKVADYTDKGLQRLYSFQQSDGGWGWWKRDQSNPYMTAYVMYGLSKAKEAGYNVSPNAVNRAMQFLTKMIPKEENLDNKAYMVYAYVHHQPDRRWADELFGMRDKLNDFALAMLTLTYAKHGRVDRVKQLAKDLEARAVITGRSCHWGEKNRYRHWASNTIQTTSFALRALVAADPKHPLLGKAVDYLVNQRRGNYWNSTKDTAAAIFALSDFMAVSGEMNPNYTAEVVLNGKVIKTVDVKGDAAMLKPVELSLSMDQLRLGGNQLEIRKNGKGNLYFASTLTYFSTGKELAAGHNQGFSINREYFKLVPKDNGSGKLEFDRVPLKGEVKSGDEIEVHLTVTGNSDRRYMMLEDYIPAGCEIVDDKSDLSGPYRYWWGYCNNREARDEKMVFFNSYIGKDKRKYIYTMRAETPGEFDAMPARAELMYEPEVNGSSGKTHLSIFEN